MNKYVKMLALLSALFCTTALRAYTCDGEGKKGEAVYTNGFALSLTSGQFLTPGYFFGSNNAWSVYFAIAPYESTNNVNGVEKDDTWKTRIGAGIISHLPIARKRLCNKMFFLNSLNWAQAFGKGNLNDAQISGSWAVSWGVGFQYRFNDKVYLSLVGPLVGYNQTTYKTTPDTIYVTTNRTWSWNILTRGGVAVTYKF